MAAEKNNSDAVKKEEDDLRPRRPLGRGLGRGLSALFEDDEAVYPQADPEGHTPGTRRMLAGIDQLEPGKFQPRQHLANEGLDELAESISVHGVLQPILVREKEGAAERFEIIAGERRWRAAQRAQLHEVPVIVLTLEDQQAAEIALIENLQREDLNAIEEGQGFQRLMKEFGHTQEKLAASLGKSRSHIANTVRLLSLPAPVQMLVRQDKLSAGHARALITAINPEALAREVISRGLSVRETEKLAASSLGKDPKSKGSGKSKEPTPKDVNTMELEGDLTNALGMKVTINMRDNISGFLKIDYKDLDQLDGLIEKLLAEFLPPKHLR